MTMLKATLITVFCLLSQACAFAPQKFSPNLHEISPTQFGSEEALSSTPGTLISSIAGLSTGLVGCIAKVMAEDDYEIAELPPTYIPVLLGIALVAGVGALTASLGNVMDEGTMRSLWWLLSAPGSMSLKLTRLFQTFSHTEANLGVQSGARAKKEIERSRSSFFKR